MSISEKTKPIRSAFDELGLHNFPFFGSFIIIFFFEDAKQLEVTISREWIIIGTFSYAIFAVYFSWFFAYLLPRNYKRQAVLFYLQRRATDIAIAISYILMDLITKSDSGDANERNRSDEELAEMCDKINPYQKFSSHFERNDPYIDFYEYFSFIANTVNQTVEKILFFSDVLTQEQIQILLNIEKDTNSPMTKNIKLASGMIQGQPVTATIPTAYASVINRLRKNSQSLLDSLEIQGSVV